MTDSSTLEDYNIKDFGNLSRNIRNSRNQYFLNEEETEGIESITSCPDRICIECGNNHSFRGNFDDTITSIDTLPAMFKEANGTDCKLQEFVN
jgi:hypothetical protein